MNDFSLDVEDSDPGGRVQQRVPAWRGRGGGQFSGGFNGGAMRSQQYSEAFGDYRGGYGPGGGFGPPRMRPYPLMACRPPVPPPMTPPPMPPPGFGPPRMRQRNFGMHRAAAFLFECDITPKYIRNLPKKLLDIIEPEYCGLCSLNFDSFTAAKNHYNSKNHYKAQKKFISVYKTQKTNKEAPIKARNLYCELCNVQITSESHGESHYAGKSHRSIVEGRKPPRNRSLLKPGMEGRIKSLIRREKKNQPKDDALPKKAVEKADPVDKNFPPELYCKICKSAVTCSEQMTSHLNGKRHLTKEKQHILKLMKGKTEPGNKKKPAAKGESKDENGADIQEVEEENLDEGDDENEEEDEEKMDEDADDKQEGDEENMDGGGDDDQQEDEDLDDGDDDVQEVVEDNPTVQPAVEEWGNGGGAEWA